MPAPTVRLTNLPGLIAQARLGRGRHFERGIQGRAQHLVEGPLQVLAQQGHRPEDQHRGNQTDNDEQHRFGQGRGEGRDAQTDSSGLTDQLKVCFTEATSIQQSSVSAGSGEAGNPVQHGKEGGLF